MKIGTLTAELAKTRLNDMKGFEGVYVKKEDLWKLLFSYLVNEDSESEVPKWLEKFYVESLSYPSGKIPKFTNFNVKIESGKVTKFPNINE